MVQNRNKLISIFIGNVSNAVVHEILEEAIDVTEIGEKYKKEMKTSFDVAKHYREKINPIDRAFPLVDRENVRKKIIGNVRSELESRISRGYQNISLELVEPVTDRILKELNI